jgi:hypothetical protein
MIRAQPPPGRKAKALPRETAEPATQKEIKYDRDLYKSAAVGAQRRLP